MWYYVRVREVHIQPYMVEADSEEKATQKIRDGEGEMYDAGFEFSHTLDSSLWGVEEMSTEDVKYHCL